MKHSFRCDAEAALVRTDRGLVKGYEHDGLLIFKGIPYAKARRFHAPEQVKAWDGVFDASKMKKSVRSSSGSTAAVTRPAPPSSIWPMTEPT